MMTGVEITDKICAILQVFNKKGVVLHEGTDIPAELQLDSVSVLDFIMEVEDSFDIEIPMNVVSEIRTVADLKNYVLSKIKH